MVVSSVVTENILKQYQELHDRQTRGPERPPKQLNVMTAQQPYCREPWSFLSFHQTSAVAVENVPVRNRVIAACSCGLMGVTIINKNK